jgi:endonuclease/exonuclease/phosphatase family metal-dependent hydrolase
MTSIRLLTYNIHKGIGGRDRRYRLERIVEVIQHEKPDIVCLQEVDRHVRRSRFDDQPHLLAEKLELTHQIYQPNVSLKHGCYGNLILSRWPMTEKHQISLRVKTKKPRGAQMVILDTPSGPLSIAHFHLGLAEGERQWQVKHLIDHHLFNNLEQHPTVLIGDTNDWRNRLFNAILLQRGYSYATTPIFKFRSFPAWFPLGSLDKVYTRGTIKVDHAKVVRSKLTRVASDHLPVVIDVTVSGKKIEAKE